MLILGMSLQVSAQGKWNLGAGNTFGFNTSNLYIWDYTVKHTLSNGVYFKIGYEFFLFHNLSIGMFPGAQQHYDEVEINNIKLKTYGYNFELPLELYYYFLNRWTVHAGVSLQDYRILDEFAIERSYNARLNLNLGWSYHFTNHWAMELGYSRILSDQRDAFLIRNYTNHILLGVRYRFNILKKS